MCRVVLLSLTLVWISSGCVQKSEKALANAEIYESFRRFRSAVDAADGSAAVAQLSQETFADFGKLRDAALSSSADEVRKLPVDLRLEVLRLRDRLTADELAALDGRGLVGEFVTRGWMNTGLLSRLRLANVIHTSRGAEVRVGDEQGLATQRVVFRREATGWKFDLSASRWMQRNSLRQVQRQRGLSEEQLIAEILRAEGAGQNLDELWLPLNETGDRRANAS